MANLFSGWDKDKIAVVCTSHMFNNLNTSICDTYYVLGEQEHKWSFPFNYLQRKVASGEVKVASDSEMAKEAAVKTSLRSKIVNNYFYPFLEYIGLFHGISKITMSDKLHQWIEAYNPDVIYAQAGVRETLYFACMQKIISSAQWYIISWTIGLPPSAKKGRLKNTGIIK